MSAQFGIVNFDGRPVGPEDLDRACSSLAPYGPDSEGRWCRDNAGIRHRAFHTTNESRFETQPCMSASGSVITWDGRLDNRAELIRDTQFERPDSATDLAIVTACFEQWGTFSFRRLIGDWALSIWDPKSRSVVLARDFVGARSLYYTIHRDRVAWSTTLDPLVLLSPDPLKLNEEYVAGWFSLFPEPQLTPYVGIRSVPPSCFVRLQQGRERITEYWDFDSRNRIRYKSDRDYEEHFREVFAASIRRRLRSNTTISAELSGGMDSCSIVCMADRLIEQKLADAPQINTITYYDNREPNWNELPYVDSVETKRGQTGYHIDLSLDKPRTSNFAAGVFRIAPTFDDPVSNSSQQFASCLAAHNSRVVLSGIGGDEFAGGVPTPLPELADLLLSGKPKLLAGQLKKWAMTKRKPWFHLFLEVVGEFIPFMSVTAPDKSSATSWLDRKFVYRNRTALRPNPSHLRLFGPPPSLQCNLRTLAVLRRQLGCSALSSETLYEKRYPFLDRTLLEFLFAIPPEQLVRPGERRSLMRRALAGIVPDEVLNRKRKAFATKAPLATVTAEWSSLLRSIRPAALASLAIVDPEKISRILQLAKRGEEIPVWLLARGLALEWWLRGVQESPASHKIQLELCNGSYCGLITQQREQSSRPRTIQAERR
jgi:asparagine synthase (glutamine-hydrolysing)